MIMPCVPEVHSWRVGQIFLGAMTALLLMLAGCDMPVRDEPEVVEETAETTLAPEVEPNGRIIEVRMYTIDPDDPTRQHVFKPELITAEVGDTIRFIPTEQSHQSSSVATMLPEGARGWEGVVNEEVSYVLPKPGIYGFECVPHYAAGMTGLVVVEGEGKTDNLAQARETPHPGLATPRFAALFAKAEAEGLFD